MYRKQASFLARRAVVQFTRNLLVLIYMPVRLRERSVYRGAPNAGAARPRPAKDFSWEIKMQIIITVSRKLNVVSTERTTCRLINQVDNVAVLTCQLCRLAGRATASFFIRLYPQTSKKIPETTLQRCPKI